MKPITLPNLRTLHFVRLQSPKISPRRSHALVVKAFNSEMLIRGVQLTTQLFTAAVFLYSGLNFFMYRRLRRDMEKEQDKKKDK